MRSYQVLVDAAADLTEALRNQYHIGQACHCQFAREQSCTLPPYQCALEQEGNRTFSTEELEAMFQAVFCRYAKEDIDILYLACAGSLFPFFAIAQTVAKEVMGAYPSVRIEVYDTTLFGAGQGMLAVEAAALRNRGEDMDAVLNRLNDMCERAFLYIALDKPKTNGPLGKRKHRGLALGCIVGLCPVFGVGRQCGFTVLARGRGFDNTVQLAVKMAKRDFSSETPIHFSFSCEWEGLEEVKNNLGDNVVVSHTSPLVGKLFGQNGVILAGVLPSRESDQDQQAESIF